MGKHQKIVPIVLKRNVIHPATHVLNRQENLEQTIDSLERSIISLILSIRILDVFLDCVSIGTAHHLYRKI